MRDIVEQNQTLHKLLAKTMVAEGSPKTVVFFCSHHSGHINPILSLVRQFAKDGGWSIFFFCDPAVKGKIEAAGAAFSSIGDLDLHQASAATIEKKFGLEQSPEVANYFFPLEILPATVYYLDPSRKLVDRVKALQPKAIVSDVSALWGILTAKILKLPLITSCSCTLFESLEPPFGHLREVEMLKMSSKWIKDTYGIEYDPMLSYMNESDFTVAFSTPEFQPPARQNSKNVHFFGPAVDMDYAAYLETEENKDRASDASLLKWLEEGEKKNPKRKVIYCSLGTVVGQEPWTIMERNEDDDDMVSCFYEKVFEVMRKKGDGYQCIVSIGKDRKAEDIKSPIPDNVQCLQHVPQIMILEKSDAFITHCGNNGMNEAFFTRCPMVCVPVFGDQHPNAQSICDLDAGVQIASPFAPLPSPNLDHVTVERLDNALEQVFETRKDDISSGIDEISKSMRQRHADFVKDGFKHMVSFIEA